MTRAKSYSDVMKKNAGRVNLPIKKNTKVDLRLRACKAIRNRQVLIDMEQTRESSKVETSSQPTPYPLLTCLSAFRLKMKNDAMAARAIIDPETYEQQNQLGMEIADVLKKNIVQGVKVHNAEGAPQGQETFSAHLPHAFNFHGVLDRRI